MSVVIRCPSCLTELSAGARRCAACGLEFRSASQRRAAFGLAVVALVAVGGAAAWWGRSRAGFERPLSPPAPGPSPVAPTVPPLVAKPSQPPPSDAPAAVESSVAPPAPELPARTEADVDESLRDLARHGFEVSTRDAQGRPLRRATAFAADREAVLAFSVLNGAAKLERTTPFGALESVAEVAAVDGNDVVFVARVAADVEPAPVAPWNDLRVGARLFAFAESKTPPAGRFVPAGAIVALEPKDGVVELAAEVPCDDRWIADADGRLVGLARRGGEATRPRVVTLARALERRKDERVAGLSTIDATWFDRNGVARRERAAWYAAGEQYEAALENYVAALELEPRLREQVEKTAVACTELALHAAQFAHRLDSLLPTLARAAALLDREPRVLYCYGLALLEKGEPEAALPFLIDAVDISGQGRGELVDALRAGYLHAGEAARVDQRPADAIRVLEDGLLRFREDEQLLESLGFAYFELGDRERAHIVLSKVASLDEVEARRLESLLTSLAPAPAAADRRQVEIRFDRSGGAIRTTARFSDRVDSKVIVDTGATITAISESLADQLKIDRRNAVRQATVTTASGRVQAPVVVLDALDLQGARVTKVEAVVLPLQEDGGAQALVGLNFLEHFSLSLDSKNGILRLAEKR